MSDAPRDATELPLAAVLAIAFAGLCTFIDLYATQPLLPAFEALFAVSKAEAGLTISAPTLAVALAAPLFGAIADRTSRRRVILSGLVGLGVTTILTATSQGLWDLVFWRFVQGVMISGIYVLVLSYISEEAGSAQVGRVMAAFVTGNVIGGFSGRTITGVLAEGAGWRAAFVVLGLVNLVGAYVTWRNLPRSRHFTPRYGPIFDVAKHVRALRNRRLVATFAIGFNVLFCLVASFTYVVFHLHAPPFGLGTAALSAIFTVYLVGAVITPFSGRFIDKLGSRAVLTVSVVSACAGLALTLAPSLVAITLGLALVCSAAFVSQSAATAYLRTAAPSDVRTLASGLYVASYYLGGSAAGVVPGLVWDWAGWSGCVALVVITELVTLTLALAGWREPQASRAVTT